MKNLNMLVKEAEDTLKVMREGLNKYFHIDDNSQLVPNLPESIQLEEPRQLVQRSFSDKQFHTDREDVETIIKSYLDPMARVDEEAEDDAGTSEHLETIIEKSETEQLDSTASKPETDNKLRASTASSKGKGKRSSSKLSKNYFANLAPTIKPKLPLPTPPSSKQNGLIIDRIVRKSRLADDTGFLPKTCNAKKLSNPVPPSPAKNSLLLKNRMKPKAQKIQHKDIVDIYLYDNKGEKTPPQPDTSKASTSEISDDEHTLSSVADSVVKQEIDKQLLAVQKLPSVEIQRELVVQKVLDIDIKSDLNAAHRNEINACYKEFVHDEASKESVFHVECFDPVTIEPGAACDCANPPKNDILSSPNVIYYEHTDSSAENCNKDGKLQEERLLDRITKISESLRASMDLLTESQKVAIYTSNDAQTEKPPEVCCVAAQTKIAELKDAASQIEKAILKDRLKIETVVTNDIRSCFDQCTCDLKGDCDCAKVLSACCKETEISHYTFENSRRNSLNTDRIPSKDCDDCVEVKPNRVVEKVEYASTDESPPSYNTNSCSNKPKKKIKEETVSKWKNFLGKISDSDERKTLDKSKCCKTEQSKKECGFHIASPLRKLKIKTTPNNMQADKMIQGMEQCEINSVLPRCCNKTMQLQNEPVSEYVLVRDTSAQISIDSEGNDYCKNFSIDNTVEVQLESNCLDDLYMSYGNKHFDSLKTKRDQAIDEMQSFIKRPSISYSPSSRNKLPIEELGSIPENEIIIPVIDSPLPNKVNLGSNFKVSIVEPSTSIVSEDKPIKVLQTKRECISKWKKPPAQTDVPKSCNKSNTKKLFHVQLEYDLPKSIRNDPLGDGPIDCMKYIKPCDENCRYKQLKFKPRKSKINLHHLFRPMEKMQTSHSTPVRHHDESFSSEGEVKCRCSVSSGELHLCKPWKNMQSLYYMKDNANGAPFGLNSKFKVARQGQLNTNVVSYYVSRSPSPGLIRADLSES